MSTTDNLSAILLRDISRLYTDADDYNVIIQVGEEPNVEIFKAHVVILRARSSYFKAALSHNWAKKGLEDIITFKKPNISPKTFRIILRYLYTGMIDIEQVESEVSLVNLLTAADELSLIELVDYLQNRIINMDSDWFQRKYGVKLLNLVSQNKIFSILQDHYNDLITKDPDVFLELEDYVELDEEIMLTVIRQDNIRMEEIDIWDKVVKWGVAQNPTINADPKTWTSDDLDSMEKMIHNCIPHIRFFHMSPRDYYYKIRPFTKLLPKQLDEDIALYFIVKDSKLLSTQLPPRAPIYKLDSEIIEAKHTALFASWIDRRQESSSVIRQYNPYEFKLLLRASRDGFSVKEFRKRCFDKGATIIVIKVTNSDQFIGGYNPVKWSGSDHFIITTESFIYSIPYDLDSTKIILSRVNNPAQAIADSDGHWIGFGDSDLYVFRRSCQKEDYDVGILDSKSFEIENYEVFQVVKRDR